MTPNIEGDKMGDDKARRCYRRAVFGEDDEMMTMTTMITEEP